MKVILFGTFVFVSGAGADSTEGGRLMWARIKGKAENAILRTPFKASYVFRPAYIQPLHGEALFPRHVTTTEQMGRAMIAVARKGAPKRLLENSDINEVG